MIEARLVLTRSTDPATEPITTAEAKRHLRVDFADDDTYIDSLIAAARQHVEEVTGRSLITQTWKLSLDGFEDVILLPRPPLVSVDSVTYVDGDGDTQTLASSVYDVHANDLPPRITLAHNQSWPTTRVTANAVTVTYQTGYGAAGDVPESLKHAVKLLVGDMYANRQKTVVGTIVAEDKTLDALLRPYRVWWF